jgi:hypothetical protein
VKDPGQGTFGVVCLLQNENTGEKLAVKYIKGGEQLIIIELSEK